MKHRPVELSILPLTQESPDPQHMQVTMQMHFTKKKDVGTTDQADPTACLKNQSRGEVCRSHCAVAPLLA